MLQNCVLRTRIGHEGGWFTMSNIKYKNKTWMIDSNGKCVEQDNEKKPLQVRITPLETYPISFDDARPDTDNQNNNELLKAALIKHHFQVWTEGFANPNLGTAVIFEFENLSDKSKSEYNELSYQRSALNKAWDMSYQQKIDAAYYFGLNPIGRNEKLMTHREISLRLLGKNGLLLSSNRFENTTFIKHFVDEYKATDENYTLKTSVLKALTQGILKRSGLAIQFGEDIIGSNINEAISWINNNEERKKFLLKEVSKKDTLDVDDLDKAVMNYDTDKPEEALAKKTSEKEYQDEGKKYGLIGSHNAKAETLIPKIKAAKQQWEEAFKLGIEFVERLSPDKVAELIKKAKEKALTAV